MGTYRLPRQTQPLRRSLPPRHETRLALASQPISTLFGHLTDSIAKAPRLADILEPERNNFSALRLMMALAVLVSHAVFLATGQFSAEPLVALTGYSLGQYGVQGFFILSGIVVTQSLVKRGDLVDYGRARALRIFPALIVCVLVTALIVGPTFSALGGAAYFKSFAVVQYILKTLSLSTGSAQLPGLFPTNPAPGVVNQSLWTLKYEVTCYLMLAGLAALVWRVEARRKLATAMVAAWAIVMLVARPNLLHENTFIETLAYFALFFGTGAVAFLMRDAIKLSWLPLIVLFAVFVECMDTSFAEIASALFMAYAITWVASLPMGRLRTFANGNDYSYGTYIYSYPVTQVILLLWPSTNIVALVLMTTGVTLLLALLSWELVERPALSLTRRWRGASASSRPVDLSRTERGLALR